MFVSRVTVVDDDDVIAPASLRFHPFKAYEAFKPLRRNRLLIA